MARGENVHGTVRRVDASMASLNRMLRKFGAPKGTGRELTQVKRAVGDLLARLELAQRRN